MPHLLRWLLPVFALVAWLAAGRQISGALDSILTVFHTSLAVSPMDYDGGFRISGRAMTFGAVTNLRTGLYVSLDPWERAVLRTGDQAFVLGPGSRPTSRPGDPSLVFTAEAGDQVSFVSSYGLLPWRAPFQWQIFGGSSPRWKRNVYYRLTWQKPSGARLEMRWRYQQEWYTGRGWLEPVMMWNSQTGLLSTTILPESAGAVGAVVRYLAGHKDWSRASYDFAPHGSDLQSFIFAVAPVCEACGVAPGAAGALELHVDRKTNQVVKELGYQ